MADVEKKIVIPVEANPQKADKQLDNFRKDASKEVVSIPVNIDISEISKSLDSLKGMVGKIEKAFDKDVRFSGIQKGLDDVLSKFKSVMTTINKGKPNEFEAMNVSLVGFKTVSEMTRNIQDNIKSLNDTKIDINSFEKLYSIFEKIESLLNSIVKGMNFDNIRPSTQIQDEITKTTDKLEKLAKSEKKIQELESYFSKKTAKGIGKDILEWGDSEGINKESSLNNLIKKMKEYISLGGDLSSLKFQVFDLETQTKELRSFADVLDILQDEGKIDFINENGISNDVVEVKALRTELAELTKELNDAKIRENRDLNVSLDTKSVEDFTSAITEAVKTVGSLHFEIPEGFTLEGLSTENLDKIIAKIEEVVASVKELSQVLSVGVDFPNVEEFFKNKQIDPINKDEEENSLGDIEKKVRDIINAVNDKTDAFKQEEKQVKTSSRKEVEALSNIEDKVSDISEHNNIELKFNSTNIYNEIDNIVSAINENIPDTKEIQIKFKQYQDTDILSDFEGKAITAYRGVQEVIGGMISDKQNGITFYSDRYDVAESYANRIHDGKEIPGKVYKTNLAMKNPLELDAHGSTWKNIKYLGDESDETSEKIIKLDQKIQNLRSELGKLYDFNNLDDGFILDEFGTIFGELEKDGKKIPVVFDTINDFEKAIGKFDVMSMLDQNKIQAQKLLEELQLVCDEYYEISDAKENMYGTHTTDEWANIARENGYDGIIVKNLYDAVGNTFNGEDSLSTIFAVFDREQLRNIEIAKDNIDELAGAENKIDGSNVQELAKSINNIGSEDIPKIKVDPQVDPIDFANKVTSQLQGASAEIDVIPNSNINQTQQYSIDTDIGTIGMSHDAEQAESLRQQITEIVAAVDAKTRAFQEEEQVVIGTVQREVSNLEYLDGQIWNIINDIEKLDNIKINIDFDGSKIDDSFINILDNIKEKTDSMPIDDLSNLAAALKGIKVTGKTAENLELVAVALSEFKDSLNGISKEGNDFLKSIDAITTRASALKDLAKILEASAKKIKEAGIVSKDGSGDENDINKQDSINKDSSSDKKKKGNTTNDDSSKTTDAINKTIQKMKELQHVGSGETFGKVFSEAKGKIDSLNAEFASGDKTIEEYNTEIKRLFSNIQDGYTNAKNKTFTFIEPKNIEAAEQAMESYAYSVSGGSATLKKAVDQSGKSVYTWIDENKIVHTLSLSYDQLTGALGKTYTQQKQFEKQHKTFMESLKQGWQNVRQYVISFLSFYEIIALIKRGISIITELDTALTEMRKVSDETVNSLKNFQKASFDVAESIGATAVEIQNSAADFMRLGYSLKEASELAKDANIYANVGDMEIDEATEHMISSIKAWGSEFNNEVEASSAIVDRYNEIGNNFAITSADIGSAMERSAAALKAGGNTLNESLGLITAGNLIQQDADTTANALKVMSLRIRGSKTELEDMGEETDGLASSTSKLRQEIKSLTGVDIMENDNTYKSTAKIIQEIGAVYDKLSDVSKASLLEQLAGKTRASTVAGLLENYKTIGEVIESAENADGSAFEENLRYMESIEGKVAQFKNEAQEFWFNLIDSDTVKIFIDLGTKLLDIIGKIIDKIGVLGTLTVAGGGLLGVKASKNGGRAKMSVLILNAA